MMSLIATFLKYEHLLFFSAQILTFPTLQKYSLLAQVLHHAVRLQDGERTVALQAHSRLMRQREFLIARGVTLCDTQRALSILCHSCVTFDSVTFVSF